MNQNTSKNRCLVCGSEEPLRRGLCQNHYKMFTRERKKVEQGKKSVVDFEKMLIDSGQLEPDRRFADNPFLAARLSLEQEAEELATPIVKVSQREENKEKAKSSASKVNQTRKGS